MLIPEFPTALSKYGSVDAWLNSREYLEYKFPGKKKIRLDIESVAKETTQEEFDSAVNEETFKVERLGITYKGKFYEFDENGNAPKEFLEELKKDRNK